MNDTKRSVRVGGPVAVAAVTLGLITWPVAFNLGAYGEVLYDDVFRVLVASSILAVITLAKPAYPAPWNRLVVAALATPLIWFIGRPSSPGRRLKHWTAPCSSCS
jgi:hypothetical protein